MQKSINYRLFFDLFKGSLLTVGVLCILQVISGVLPISITWMTAQLVDTLSQYTTGLETTIKSNLSSILWYVGVSCLLMVLNEILYVMHGFFSDYFKDFVYQRVQVAYMKKIATYPTQEIFENTHYSNLIALAHKSIDSVNEYISVASQILQGIFGIIPAFIWMCSLKWWIPLVLLATMIPFFYFKSRIENKSWNIKSVYAPVFNQLNNLEQVLTQSQYSKDIRLNSMQAHLLKKWERGFKQFLSAANQVRTSGVIYISCLAVLGGVGILIPFVYIIHQSLQGFYTLGQLVFFLGVLIQFQSRVAGLIYTSADIARAFLSAKSIIELLSIPEVPKSNVETDTKLVSRVRQAPEIEFKNVSFKYYGTSQTALKNINLTLKSNTSLAIVGTNGAGKSTLIKLICKLYDPSEGAIYWNGSTIAESEYAAYRKKINVCFQDFAQFPMSVRDNLDLNGSGISDDRLRDALKSVGLDAVLGTALDTVLCKNTAQGRELSGGQWQRLALARMQLQLSETELLIFDEPTSALDPHAEHQAMEAIRKMMQHTTSIIISHRLALTRSADTILVLHDGAILESGNHVYLMAQKGAYFDMFTKQASYYKE